ncbi:MAG: hypothetical protein AAGU77_13650 [Bacillota bacterium]
MSTKTGKVLCVIAGLLAVIAGAFVALYARDFWPLVVAVPAAIGGVLGIAGGAALGKNDRTAGALLIAAVAASMVCLNLVSGVVFIVVRGYAFHAPLNAGLQES